jgi:hypothetical protein
MLTCRRNLPPFAKSGSGSAFGPPRVNRRGARGITTTFFTWAPIPPGLGKYSPPWAGCSTATATRGTDKIGVSVDIYREMLLTEAQQKAAIALAQGKGVTGAAKAAKVSRDLIYDWKKIPEFADLVASTRRQLWEEAISQAVGMVGAMGAAPTPAVGRRDWFPIRDAI